MSKQTEPKFGEWQPIETHDGSPWAVLVLSDHVRLTAYISFGGWKRVGDGQIIATPTHWMQLPNPPKP